MTDVMKRTFQGGLPLSGLDARYAPTATATTATIAGRSILQKIGGTGAPVNYAAATWQRTWYELTPSGTTSIRVSGCGTTPSTNGTVSTIVCTKDNPPLFQLASSAGAAARADLIIGSPITLLIGGANDLYGGFFLHSCIRLPDASYNNTGVSTGSRIWAIAGYNSSSTTLLNTARGGTQHLFGFNREHINGGNTDTNWVFVTCDSSTTATGDTGMPFAVSHVYDFWVWCPKGSATMYWQVDDVTAGTTASGSTAAHLPSATVALNVDAGLYTVDAVARSIQFRDVFITTDTG